MLRTLAISACASVLLLSWLMVSGHGQQSKKNDDLAKHLIRPRPLTPAQAIKTFQIEKRFRIELAASEQNVVNPIVMAWDEDGRLYVSENGRPRRPRSANNSVALQQFTESPRASPNSCRFARFAAAACIATFNDGNSDRPRTGLFGQIVFALNWQGRVA